MGMKQFGTFSLSLCHGSAGNHYRVPWGRVGFVLSILNAGALHGSQEGVWLRTAKLRLGVGSVVSHRSYWLRECSRSMNGGTATVTY